MKLFNQARKYGPRLVAFAGAGALGVANAAVTLDPAISTAIADGIALILLVIGLGGAGYLVISGASVGWTVASKFIRRLGGKA
jgi:hypothetical protein